MHKNQKRFHVKLTDRFSRETSLEISGRNSAKEAAEFAKAMAIPGSEPKVVSVEAIDPDPDDIEPEVAAIPAPAKAAPTPATPVVAVSPIPAPAKAATVMPPSAPAGSGGVA